jgi:kynurenine formamidase
MDACVVIYCDNISSILLVNNLVYHVGTKHIEVHYHFIRDKNLVREINLIHVSFEDQVVDIFAKALGTDKLRKLLKNVWCTRIRFELGGEC